MKAKTWGMLGIWVLLALCGIGLFFVFPIGFVVVPFVVIPGFLVYSLYRFFDEDQGTYSRKRKASKKASTLAPKIEGDEPEKPIAAIYSDGQWSGDKAFSGELKDRIESFLEQFPSDSHCTVKLSKFGERWLIRFNINSVQERFTALGMSKDLDLAVDSAERQLVDQLEIWRKDRFANSKWMKTFEKEVLSTLSQKTVGRPVRVLIVDDDVDAALLVDSVFREKGCETRLALNVDEAKEMMSQMNSDIIVLDWKLSRDVNADQILKESISKLERRQEFAEQTRPKVVTYSNLPGNEIDFPESKYFSHFEHWKKPIMYKDLSNKTREVIDATS